MPLESGAAILYACWRQVMQVRKSGVQVKQPGEHAVGGGVGVATRVYARPVTPATQADDLTVIEI